MNEQGKKKNKALGICLLDHQSSVEVGYGFHAFIVNSQQRMICIDSIVNPAMCLIVCMHERDYIIVIILSMMKLLNPKS